MKAAWSPEELFERFLRRWHSEEKRRLVPGCALFPDVLQIEPNEERKSPITGICDSDGAVVASYIEDYVGAASRDFAENVGLRDSGLFDAADGLDAYFDEARVLQIIERSNPSSDLGDKNEYAVLCCEIGAFLGHLLCRERAGLSWHFDFPIWDSWIGDLRAGNFAPVFHWGNVRGECEGDILNFVTVPRTAR